MACVGLTYGTGMISGSGSRGKRLILPNQILQNSGTKCATNIK